MAGDDDDDDDNGGELYSPKAGARSKTIAFDDNEVDFAQSQVCPRCSKGLKKYQLNLRGWTCDICEEDVPVNEWSYGCRDCNFDKCTECWEKRLNFVEGNYVKVVTADDGLLEGQIGEVVELLAHRQVSVEFSGRGCGKPIVKTMPETVFVITDKPKSHVPALVGMAVVCALFVYGIAHGAQCGEYIHQLVRWCKSLGPLAPFVVFAVSAALPVFMLPCFPMMVLSGPLFVEMNDGDVAIGGSIAFLAVFAGLWLGSTIAFALGKYVFQSLAEEASRSNRFMQHLNRVLDKGGCKMVLLARMLPILPGEVFDYAASLTSLKVYEYAAGCVGSGLPTAFWVFTSAQAASGASGHSSKKQTFGLILINIVLLVSISVFLFRLIKESTVDSSDSEDDEENEDITSLPEPQMIKQMTNIAAQARSQWRCLSC